MMPEEASVPRAEMSAVLASVISEKVSWKGLLGVKWVCVCVCVCVCLLVWV